MPYTIHTMYNTIKTYTPIILNTLYVYIQQLPLSGVQPHSDGRNFVLTGTFTVYIHINRAIYTYIHILSSYVLVSRSFRA